MRPAANGRRRVVRWLSLLPTALLVLVAANQLRLAHTAGLSAWKGGGFGMFASTDGGPNRSLRIVATEDGRDFELELPRSLFDLADRAEELPNQRWLSRLACALLAETIDSGRSIDAIRLEVWRTRYAAADLQPSWERLAQLHQMAGACGR